MASRGVRERYRRRIRKRRICRYWTGPSVDSRILPQRPSTICRRCWRGPCAARFGLLTDTSMMFTAGWRPDDNTYSQGYSYSISSAGLKTGARSGCVWCESVVGLLESKGSGEPWGRSTRRWPATIQVDVHATIWEMQGARRDVALTVSRIPRHPLARVNLQMYARAGASHKLERGLFCVHLLMIHT
ncbi:hypothetical protein C8Q77DRAFT_236347 [Trametes polyzona]|nr:hypothetical protein C8Q77DRAFT_236347 [Trametes polyzona]